MKECELVYPSFLGKIVIRFIGDKIVKIFVIKDNKENIDIVKINKNYIQVYKEFDRYFSGLKEEFSYTRKFLDFSFLTVFQRKVYNELMKIEYGSFITYTQLARKLGNENLRRAVGIALKMNPFLIVVPCHRVIGKHSIGGFSVGIDVKMRLIELESA